MPPSPGPPVRLRLLGPQRVAAGSVVLRGQRRERVALRIRLVDAQGLGGLGEALPLPGYSRDDADTAAHVLATLARRCAAGGLPLAADEAAPASSPDAHRPRPGRMAQRIAATLEPFAAELDASPAARFALECALLDLLARRAGLSAGQALAGGRALQPVPVSVLLPDEAAATVPAAVQAARAGHGVLKLKVARSDRSAAQEDALLRDVRLALDAAGAAGVRLRLDANGALDPDTLAPRLAGWQALGVELVEEPLAGDALLHLPPLPLPWAADESLDDPKRAASLLALPRGRGPAALVLKPAQLGLLRCLQLATEAAAQGMGLIVTHSLDGDLGHAAACALAQALPAPPWPCGVAPHAGLRHPRPAVPWLAEPVEPGLGVDDEGGWP